MLTAILLVCTGQLSISADPGVPDKYETVVAVSANARDFLVFEGRLLTLTKVKADIYKFDQTRDRQHMTGNYDFASGELLFIKEFENLIDPKKPGLRITVKAVCTSPVLAD